MIGNLVYDGFIKVYKNDKGIETVTSTDSVAFLVHIQDRGEVVLIVQDRVPMIRSGINDQGVIVEAPAGRFDGKYSVAELVVKEANEELGATVDLDSVEIITPVPLALSPGILTERMFLAFAAITSLDIEEGDGDYGLVEEGELIHRHFVPVAKLPYLHHQDMKTFALVHWFLNHLRMQGRSI